MIEFVSEACGLRVLEIGCGNGTMGESMLASSIASEYFGVELFKDAADEAEERLAGVICGGIESIEPRGLKSIPVSTSCISGRHSWIRGFLTGSFPAVHTSVLIMFRMYDEGPVIENRLRLFC